MEEEAIAAAFIETRQQSLSICAPLLPEDYCLQAAAFASPPKWHLAHTSWFFETFILKAFANGYESPEPLYEVLFNSYYQGIGAQHPRDQRGLLTRPPMESVLAYREFVDTAVLALAATAGDFERKIIYERMLLGIEHERQHQELFFTDIKYSLSANPLYPEYLPRTLTTSAIAPPLRWLHDDGGLISIGHAGPGFCFDNELPRHRYFVEPFEFANRLISNGEFQDFIDDGGYQRPDLWLADGWAIAVAEGWDGPLHWCNGDGEQREFTLYGLLPRDAARPVCHVSGYEAEAFARWAGARLPTEQEWEKIAGDQPDFLGGMDAEHYHPRAAVETNSVGQLYGECWQWTRSAYTPYPGYQASPGAIGEYNGKFMSNQWVLRGGSCVTKSSQARPTYRNFFYPQDRWQFSGIRLARTPDKEANQ